MSRKQKRQNAPRKSARNIPCLRRVRPLDPATYDSGIVRFGTGCAPAILKK